MFIFDPEADKSPRDESSTAANVRGKKRRGKKVIRPTFSNNPFQVYSIYFTKCKQNAKVT